MGGHLNFLSNDTQNKLVSIISQQINKTIVIAIEQCRAWAIIVDTTPDVTSCEQVSICNRTVSEHLLAIQKANSTTAENTFDLLISTLQSKDLSINWLHKHMMEHLTQVAVTTVASLGSQRDKFQCYLCTLLCQYTESSVV